MRIKETANLCDLVEQSIRRQIPAGEFQNVIDNIGLPYSGINLSYSNSAPVGTSDADILVTLSANHHPTDNYIRQLRLTLPKQFPGVSFAFLPADMVGQILNFGLPAAIDVQVVGNDLEGNSCWFRRVPMALGLGDGGEQNAPLGRAVIGGLLFATVSTLFFVPAFFSVMQGSRRHLDQTKHAH